MKKNKILFLFFWVNAISCSVICSFTLAFTLACTRGNFLILFALFNLLSLLVLWSRGFNWSKMPLFFRESMLTLLPGAKFVQCNLWRPQMTFVLFRFQYSNYLKIWFSLVLIVSESFKIFWIIKFGAKIETIIRSL